MAPPDDANDSSTVDVLDAAGNGSATSASGVWASAEADEDIFQRMDVRVSLILAYSIVFCCCFFGNLLVVLVVVVHRRMRTITNFFLTNLAVADLCVGLFCVYQNMSVYLMGEWPFGDFLCRMYFFIQALSYTASVGILTVICVERYIAIVHPMWSKHVITLRRLRIVVLSVWLVSAGFCSPRLIMCGTAEVPSHDEPGRTIHICIMRRFLYDSRTYDVLNFVVCFFVPLAIMSVMYSIIGLQLWRSSVPTAYSCSGPRRATMELLPLPRANSSGAAQCRESLLQDKARGVTKKPRQAGNKKHCFPIAASSQVHQHYQQQAAATVLRARRKVIRLLVAVVLGFAVCNLPFHARKFYQYWSSSYEGASRSAVSLTIATTLVLYMNSFINPILYAFLSDNFRRSMKDVLMCRSRRKIRRLSSNRSNGKTTASSVFQHQENTVAHTNGFV
ncbi:trissin receptor-like [Dermacentor andersoni]|uniref:trissin receptor-like n=1 Tax=Dermacentor andersoni TaxID=34620 RepID=UPI0021556F98|nr:trissin receptor-like [Dermacentor andersoni]